MAHDHAPPGQVVHVPWRVRRGLIVAIAPFVAATVLALIVLWPSDPTAPPALGREVLARANVTTVTPIPCGESDSPGVAPLCVEVTADLDDGPDAGESTSFVLSRGPGAPTLEEGDRVLLSRSGVPGSIAIYTFTDYQRDVPVLALFVAFAIAVIALGRRRGLAALLALGLSLLVLVRFLLPALLEGTDPLLAAVVASAAVMFVALYITHGFRPQTSIAVLGTLTSLALTALLAGAFLGVARFSGLASEEATFLQVLANEVDLRGLLLAGIVVGSLGVLDDVTVTQVSAVWQLRAANVELGARQLYRSALEIGRDHIGSTVNTLVLAYAGASLPLLLLFTLGDRSLRTVLTGEVVAEEVARTLVGSIGLVASVPITTALAVWAVTRPEGPERPRRDTSDPWDEERG